MPKAEYATNLEDAAIKQIVLLAHPVGSYYWSSDKTSPADLFGGEWEAITDKFVYAVASTSEAGQEGGAATVALSAAEMPSHTHTGPSHTHMVGAHAHGLNGHTHTIPNHVHHIGPHQHTLKAHRADEEAGITTGSTYGLWSTGNGFNGRPLVGTTTFDEPKNAVTSLSGEGDLASNGGGGATSGPSAANTANSAAFETGGSGTGATGAAGSGTAHNNMPPYVTAYCWRRTA